MMLDLSSPAAGSAPRGSSSPAESSDRRAGSIVGRVAGNRHKERGLGFFEPCCLRFWRTERSHVRGPDIRGRGQVVYQVVYLFARGEPTFLRVEV